MGAGSYDRAYPELWEDTRMAHWQKRQRRKTLCMGLRDRVQVVC
jgi:hypothetical protein